MLRLHLPHPSKPTSITHPRFTVTRHFHHSRPNLSSSNFSQRTHNLKKNTIRCKAHDTLSLPLTPFNDDANYEANITKYPKAKEVQEVQEKTNQQEKSFWGAVSLIIGTAVGPGMLALPAATIKSGPIPSTIVILFSWVYVISSILLVAELSYAAMKEDGVQEVSFTGLATKTLGSGFGAFVAVVYASLSFSLLVACVSGVGSIVSQWFPWMNLVMANALCPLAVGTVTLFFPFNAIDTTNRFLCLIMVLSLAALVGVGLSVAKTNILGSFGFASWSLSSIMPAIPVTVLTLGFHIITPFICKIAGNTIQEARKAILFGGTIPLVMVLSWNLIVLILAGSNRAASFADPISLLLSLNPSAVSAVQGFAFTALATSLIGYAISFPKQLLDTFELIFGKNNLEKQISSQPQMVSNAGNEVSNVDSTSESELKSSIDGFDSFKIFATIIVLAAPVLIASFFPSAFSKALDFAGVYANCFLFGILPPTMAYVYQSRKTFRSSVLPGGDGALILLFGIAVILGIWH